MLISSNYFISSANAYGSKIEVNSATALAKPNNQQQQGWNLQTFVWWARACPPIFKRRLKSATLRSNILVDVQQITFKIGFFLFFKAFIIAACVCRSTPSLHLWLRFFCSFYADYYCMVTISFLQLMHMDAKSRWILLQLLPKHGTTNKSARPFTAAPLTAVQPNTRSTYWLYTKLLTDVHQQPETLL